MVTLEWERCNRRVEVTGCAVVAQFDDDAVVVYQAYARDIASAAVRDQRLDACPRFSRDRMTWIKPSFLWMMHRSGWAHKAGQECVLAISIRRSTFDAIVGIGVPSSTGGTRDAPVVIQWDPEYDAADRKLDNRRAIQIGLRNSAVHDYLEGILSIEDISERVHNEYQLQPEARSMPVERVYP